MLPVQECREAFSVRRRRRSNQGFVEFDFRRLSSEEQVNEMVSCFFHLHVKFVCACVSVFTLTVWTSDAQRTSVTREALHLPAESFRRRAHEGMSAVIPKRGMLLYQLDKRYDTRGATIIAIEWLFVLLKGPFS